MTNALSHHSQNILAIHQLATADERVEGATWYLNALIIAEDLGARYKLGGRLKAIGVIAALSPRNRWERNVQDADALIAAFNAGGAEQARLCLLYTSDAADE